jgi:hypothetical protein
VAFPQSVLPVRVRIAPGGQPAADPATWVWVDITADVRVAGGITIEQGRPDEATNVDPGKCTLTIDNRSGNYSTRNVTGQWFGKLKKNTPIRVGTIAVADTFTRTVANAWGTAPSGQLWSASGGSFSVNGSAAQISTAAANTAFQSFITGQKLLDVDLQFTCSLPAVATGASVVFAVMLRCVDASNHYLVSCELNPAGTVSANIRRVVAGAFTALGSATVPGLTYTAGQKIRVRVQVDGPALRIMCWPDGGTPPTTWHTTATDTLYQDAGLFGFYLWRVVGNTNTSPYVASFDDLEIEAVEFTGTVPEWPTRWDKSRKDTTTPITAAGILRRLQQGKSPLQSPITRNFNRFAPVAYWTLEDNSGATAAASAVLGAAPAAARNAEFADDTTLPGASQTVGITASTVLAGTIPGHTATGKWGVVFYAKLLAPPAAGTRIMTVTSTGTVRLWAVDLDSGGIIFNGFAQDGSVLLTLPFFYPAEMVPPVWTAFDMYVSESGGNVTGTLIVHAVGDTTGFTAYNITGTIAGTAGSPTSWRAEGSLGYNGGHLSHVAVFNKEPAFGGGDFTAASNGYIGEKAADRVRRLCTEEKVQVVIEAGESEPLGPQRTDTFLNLLYSAQDADMGVLYERGAGLGYRPRFARYNRPVELALDFAQGHVSEPPEPTDDDQRLRNQVTVTRDNGSSATALDQASIDESGLYDDSKTINVQTDWILPHHASARVKLGTTDEYRWPKIDLNLARNTSMIATWGAASAFPRVTIANEPSQVRGNAVDVIVEGFTETLGPYGWDVTLNCSPASAWSVGVVDDDVLGRADTDGAQLRAEPNPAATTLLVDVIAGPRITTDPTQLPVLVSAGTGEDMRITNVTGTSNPQTLTVVRGLNGVNLPIPAGTDISLTVPMRAAL